MALPLRTIYYYAQQTWPEVEEAFGALERVRLGLVKKGVKIEDTLYAYVEPINNRIKSHWPNDPFWPIDQQTIRLLDLDLVEQYVLNPLNKEVADALSAQLFNVYAGLGLLPVAEPYTPDELKYIIVKQTPDIYNARVWLFTLRKVVEGWFTEEIVPILAALVLPDPAPSSNRLPQSHEEALISNLILQILWWFFSYLPRLGQESLVKNFLYQGVVSQIKIMDALKQALNQAGFNAPKLLKIFADAAVKSRELVPTKTTGEEWKPLEELINGFYSRATGRPASGFVQEQYAREVYGGQGNRDFFSAWLREVINIVVHLRAGDL